MNLFSNTAWKRFFGIILLVGALLGIILSISGLVLVWVEAPRVVARITGLIDLSARSLDSTQSGLAIISASLDQSRQSIQLMESTAADIGTSLDKTIPMVHSTAGLVGDDMTAIIKKTQDSLASAQSSARFVDDTLRLVSSIPLLGQRYSPNGSLSDSLGQVSTSLDGLPASLQELSGNLNTSADNLQRIRDRVDSLTSDIQQMDASAGQAQDVVRRYQTQVSELQADVSSARKNAPALFQVAKWMATLFFIWLAAAQVGLALQGIELLSFAGAASRVVPEGKVLAPTSLDQGRDRDLTP